MSALPENVSRRHRAYSADWSTPDRWWDWVARTFHVEASEIFDPCPADWDGEISGLDIQWGSPCYCNHPGSRGSTGRWWSKYQREQERHGGRLKFVWCAFSVEQLRHMYPSPFSQPGWLVMPRERESFVWAGPDIAERKNAAGRIVQSARHRGEPMTSPSNWSVWWTTEPPATPPVKSVIVRTA